MLCLHSVYRAITSAEVLTHVPERRKSRAHIELASWAWPLCGHITSTMQGHGSIKPRPCWNLLAQLTCASTPYTLLPPQLQHTPPSSWSTPPVVFSC